MFFLLCSQTHSCLLFRQKLFKLQESASFGRLRMLQGMSQRKQGGKNPVCLSESKVSFQHLSLPFLGPWACCSYPMASGEPAFPFYLCRVCPTTRQSERGRALGPSALLHIKIRSTQQWHQQEFCHSESETDISPWVCSQMWEGGTWLSLQVH